MTYIDSPSDQYRFAIPSRRYQGKHLACSSYALPAESFEREVRQWLGLMGRLPLPQGCTLKFNPRAPAFSQGKENISVRSSNFVS